MANKGDYKGECNRTACSNESAVYYNHSTRKYYCEKCALLINDYNHRDAQVMFGHDLCTLGELGTVTDSLIDQPFILTNPYRDLYDMTDITPKDKPLKHSGYYTAVRTKPKINRNSSCTCGSNKKYKNCCLQ